MDVVLRLPVTAGLAAAALLLLAESAAACSCAYVEPEAKLRRSDGAVVARLLAVKPVGDDRDGAIGSADPTDFVYRTGRVLKGRPRLRRGRRLVVRSVRLDASCGLSSRVGRLTGLFLQRDGGRWRAYSCDEVTAGEMRGLGRRGAVAAAGPAPFRVRRCASGRAPGTGG